MGSAAKQTGSASPSTMPAQGKGPGQVQPQQVQQAIQGKGPGQVQPQQIQQPYQPIDQPIQGKGPGQVQPQLPYQLIGQSNQGKGPGQVQPMQPSFGQQLSPEMMAPTPAQLDVLKMTQAQPAVMPSVANPAVTPARVASVPMPQPAATTRGLAALQQRMKARR